MTFSVSTIILSLYEPDVRVVVRGKADAEVEFGNTVLIGENGQGIILDYQVWREPAPAAVNISDFANYLEHLRL